MMLKHKKKKTIASWIHQRTCFLIFPLSNVHVFWWIPGASFSFSQSILVLEQICKILAKIHWPISKKQLYVSPRSKHFEFFPMNSLKGVKLDLMIQSYLKVVFLGYPLFFWSELEPSVWYLAMALGTAVLLQAIYTEVSCSEHLSIWAYQMTKIDDTLSIFNV